MIGRPGPALAAAALLAALAAGACGGNEEESGDDTARDISAEELSRMPLSLGAFGPEYAGFAPGAEANGPLTPEEAAQDDFDPAAEQLDLQLFGFLSGYETYFSGERAKGGAFLLGSEVSLFETTEGASGYLDDARAEISQDVGKTNRGATLKEAQELNADVADQSVGARGVLSIAGQDGASTDAWFVAVPFRRGRLIGSAAMYAIGASDLEKQRLEGKVKSLAGTMNERMREVLGGVTVSPPE